jgi:hypothetical protein
MRQLSTTALFSLPLLACASGGDVLDVGDSDVTKAGDGKYDSSVEAVFVDMEFDGTLLAPSTFGVEARIEDQLLYTVGHLNGDRSVGRLDRVELSDIETTPVEGGVEIRYHARLPVAWGMRDNVPASYTFELPRDLTFEGQQTFVAKYAEDCVDFGAHDVDSGTMWYYYRNRAFRCELDPADIVTIEATVSLSTINTTGKFPEYHKVWEDDVLEVVAVFGKYEDGATSNFDAGISAYNAFVSRLRGELGPFNVVTEPASVPSSPGVDMPEVEFFAAFPDGKQIHVVALLVDNVRTAGPTFDARYRELSTDADLIAYNGHAGLGANIRALARKGEWKTGQYVVVFMNGCDTYAYVDGAINEAHAAVNPDDPTGTKHVDMVTNALPAFFHSTPGATLALLRGLMSYESPVTYEQIFTNVDRAQVVLVSGEADNEFVPGGGGGGEGEDWDGLDESGTVARDQEIRFSTPTLRPGRYVFDMTGTADADLYVRLGAEPTAEAFDCRPFKAGSSETCVVDVTTPVALHVMVRGWAASSEFDLVGGEQ